MKKTKIIIPALGMLLLSTAASVSGTVAWFSMNNTVTVTGMTVTTKVSSNLQIAQTNLEANYGDSLEQARAGILEPVSSADAVDFYYTVSAAGNGAAKAAGENGASTYTAYDEANGTALENTYANKAKYDAGFNSAYGFASPSIGDAAGVKWTQEEIDAAQDGDPAYGKTTDDWKIAPNKLNQNVCYGYIDYSFYLKGGYATEGHRISMTKCEMSYNGGNDYGAITTAWAWRVAMFAQPCNANDNNSTVTDATAAATTYQKTILDFASSQNQNETGENPDVNPKAVVGEGDDDLAFLTNPNAQAIVDNNPTLNQTQRYKVIVRLWLEGEDVSCTTATFAQLTTDWKLDLEFKLGDPAAVGFQPVTTISTPNA